MLLEAARGRGVPRYLQVSTDEVYGSIAEGSFTEELAAQPVVAVLGHQGRRRPAGAAHAHTYGIQAVICRGSNNYGPHQYPEKLIPLACSIALHGDTLPVYGDGRRCATGCTSRTSRGDLLALERGRCGEVYNIGGPYEAPNIDVVHRVVELTGGTSR